MNKKLLSLAAIFACSSLTVLAAEEVVADTTAEVAAPAPAATLFEEFVCPEIASNISLSMGVAYESEYVFRGLELGGGIVSPSVDLEYSLNDQISFYAGYWGAYGVDSEGDVANENDLYLGVNYAATDFMTVSFGYTAYTYVGGDHTNEIGLTFSFDTSSLFANGLDLAPYIAVFYDFDLDSQFVIETGISYSIPVSQYITGGDWGSIDLAYYMGYADYATMALKYGGADYFYTGFGVDFSVAVTESCGFSVGLRYAYNTADGLEDCNSNLWFGTSMSIGF